MNLVPCPLRTRQKSFSGTVFLWGLEASSTWCGTAVGACLGESEILLHWWLPSWIRNCRRTPRMIKHLRSIPPWSWPWWFVSVSTPTSEIWCKNISRKEWQHHVSVTRPKTEEIFQENALQCDMSCTTNAKEVHIQEFFCTQSKWRADFHFWFPACYSHICQMLLSSRYDFHTSLEISNIFFG